MCFSSSSNKFDWASTQYHGTAADAREVDFGSQFGAAVNALLYLAYLESECLGMLS